MPTLNYTTSVSAAKSIGEVQTMLVKHGADAVMTRYTDGEPTGLSFRLPTLHGVREFTMPVDVDAVWRLLQSQGKTPQMMLPYLHVKGEVTLYDAYCEREQLAIEGG